MDNFKLNTLLLRKEKNMPKYICLIKKVSCTFIENLTRFYNPHHM